MLKASLSRALAFTLLFLALSLAGEVQAAAQGTRAKPLRISSSFTRIAVPGSSLDDESFSFDLSALELNESSDEEEQEADEEEGDSERLKSLKKIKFDRRPSAALAAWAKKPEDKQEPDVDTNEAPQATSVDTSGMSEEEAAEAIADAENAAARSEK